MDQPKISIITIRRNKTYVANSFKFGFLDSPAISNFLTLLKLFQHSTP